MEWKQQKTEEGKAWDNGGLENVLFEWFRQRRADNIPIDWPILHAKATMITVKMIISGFKALDRWLHCCKKNISYREVR